jgi:hypothetical protein
MSFFLKSISAGCTPLNESVPVRREKARAFSFMIYDSAPCSALIGVHLRLLTVSSSSSYLRGKPKTVLIREIRHKERRTSLCRKTHF